MKVLCLIDGLGSGGAQRQMINLAVGLKNRGYFVEMIAYTDADFYLKKLKCENISYKVIGNKNYLERVIKIRNYIRKAKPDVVISFLETPNFISCVSSIGRHQWVLITSERNAKEYEFKNKRGKFMKWFERFSDWTVCNSKVAEQLWDKYYPQYKNRVSTIYNPVIIQKIPIKKNNEDAVLRIVIAASYQKLKNPLGLVEAFHLLDDEYKQRLHIDWYGKKIGEENGGVYEKAFDLRKKYGLEKYISFNDETKEIYKEMINSDAVALFSEVEGLPNTICEGMMCGKPILMSRMSDYNTLVSESNGFLCDANDPTTIAEALRKFVDLNPKKRNMMGNASKEMAQILFDPEKNIDQWEDIIMRLLEKKKNNDFSLESEKNK